MTETYVKLMLQQHTSEDAAFYEKLEQVQPKKKTRPLVRAAIVAAFICLMIPIAVWAVDNILSVPKVILTERPTTVNDLPGEGLDIIYEDLKHYSVKDFPKYLQNLEEGQVILHDDWAAAEEYLGINLIDNPLFTAEDTHQVAAFGEANKNCQGIYYVWDGQFYGAKIGSLFNRNGTRYVISAMITADPPSEIAEDVDKYYHGYNITYAQYPKKDITISTEEYVTKSGIPVLLVTVTEHSSKSKKKWDDLIECNAFFSVNNISYIVGTDGYSFSSTELDTYSGPKEKMSAALKDFLDGFVVE